MEFFYGLDWKVLKSAIQTKQHLYNWLLSLGIALTVPLEKELTPSDLLYITEKKYL